MLTQESYTSIGGLFKLPVVIYIEHRRHSERYFGGQHLNQRGVDLAKRVGDKMLTFDYVVSSPLPRALQTSVAFGFGINEARNEIQDFQNDFRPMPPWEGGFKALYDYFSEHPESRVFFREFVQEILQKNPLAKKILFVSHSGIVESNLLSCVQDPVIREWGENLSYCEGVSWESDGHDFFNPQIHRV